MSQMIAMNLPIAELAAQDPHIITIMQEIGFTDITRPGMLQTAGRLMTLEKGAALKRISHEQMRQVFAQHGYTLCVPNKGGNEQ
ncbi:DUF1858 domain-containing protein [Paenibacillus dauci]|uniref:DUF1858 domain-containing protein n=1 Tax=Paenibacillus dauci TaxID=1567106 RepID=UPI000619FCEF|nr:DUF1858 domain-containing protein [Paenibacillus dauci]